MPSRPQADTSSATARGAGRRADRRELALEQLRVDARLGTLVDELPERRGEARRARGRAERGRRRRARRAVRR